MRTPEKGYQNGTNPEKCVTKSRYLNKIADVYCTNDMVHGEKKTRCGKQQHHSTGTTQAIRFPSDLCPMHDSKVTSVSHMVISSEAMTLIRSHPCQAANGYPDTPEDPDRFVPLQGGKIRKLRFQACIQWLTIDVMLTFFPNGKCCETDSEMWTSVLSAPRGVLTRRPLAEWHNKFLKYANFYNFTELRSHPYYIVCSKSKGAKKCDSIWPPSWLHPSHSCEPWRRFNNQFTVSDLNLNSKKNI